MNLSINQPYSIMTILYYGFGWNLDPADPDHIYHGGELEGFRTLFDRNLRSRTVIILLSNNSSDRLQEMAQKIRNMLW